MYEADEGGYWAEVLDLPGCVAQAENLIDLQHNIVAAIEAYEAAQLEDGQPLRRAFHTLSVLAERGG